MTQVHQRWCCSQRRLQRVGIQVGSKGRFQTGPGGGGGSGGGGGGGGISTIDSEHFFFSSVSVTIKCIQVNGIDL
jgi:hypothetical protein